MNLEQSSSSAAIGLSPGFSEILGANGQGRSVEECCGNLDAVYRLTENMEQLGVTGLSSDRLPESGCPG